MRFHVNVAGPVLRGTVEPHEDGLVLAPGSGEVETETEIDAIFGASLREFFIHIVHLRIYEHK